MKIDRQQFLQEMKVRKFIRKGIELYFEKKEQESNKAVLEEQKLRSIIRDLIKETATPDNDPAPAKSTGINVLEDLLKKIIPVLEIDYKKLTSDKRQRDSFRAHIVKGVEDVLAPPKALNKAGEAEEEPVMEQEDEIEIQVDSDKPEDDASFIDIEPEKKPPFTEAIKEVWAEDHARRFTIFVFASMLAYSAQDLILEPFVGLTFGWTVGETTALAGIQHAGMLLGMFAMAVSTYAFKSRTRHVLHLWIRGGCLVSAISLSLLAFGGMTSTNWPINLNVFVLGIANGSFAVAAIGGMMMLAGQGRKQRDGLRMGLWGAAQAISFAMGGFLGTVAVDITGLWLSNPAASYGLVFLAEAVLFVWAASLIFNIDQQVNADAKDSDVINNFALKNQLGGSNP